MTGMDIPDNTFIAGMDMSQYIHNRYGHALDNTFIAGMGMHIYGRFRHTSGSTAMAGMDITLTVHSQQVQAYLNTFTSKSTPIHTYS